jgi:phytol kinase
MLSMLLLGISVASSNGFRAVIGADAARPFGKISTTILPSSGGGSRPMSSTARFQSEESGEATADQPGDDEATKKYPKQRYLAGTVLALSLTAATVAAKTGLLRGVWDNGTQSYSTYTDSMILQDLGSTALCSILAIVVRVITIFMNKNACDGCAYRFACTVFIEMKLLLISTVFPGQFIKLVTLGYQKDLYNANVARKLIHTLSAPLFILFWPLFTSAMDARFFAVCVPLANMVRLIVAGTGGDASLASSVSRSGDKSEALGGPLLYVIVLQLCILLFWRGPVGVVTTSTMAFGDGMADLIGRKFGRSNKWFFSEDKSIVGTVAFAFSSGLGSFGLLNWLQSTGCMSIPLDSMDLLLRVSAISCICSLVELLDIGDDNYTVPLACLCLSWKFLPS